MSDLEPMHDRALNAMAPAITCTKSYPCVCHRLGVDSHGLEEDEDNFPS